MVDPRDSLLSDLPDIGVPSGTEEMYVDDGLDKKVSIDNLLSNTAYGSVWGNEIAWTQAGAVQDTWYLISIAAMADGQLNRVTHDGDGQLTVLKAADYHCTYAVSMEADAANQHVQVSFCVNGTPTDDGMNHIDTVGINREQAVAGTAILALAVDDTLEIAIRTTDAGTPDLLVSHLNIAIHEVR